MNIKQQLKSQFELMNSTGCKTYNELEQLYNVEILGC